jgi:hypothetical protein
MADGTARKHTGERRAESLVRVIVIWAVGYRCVYKLHVNWETVERMRMGEKYTKHSSVEDIAY